ncbi:hypothetical protein [Microlunatus aurantiacus]
MSFFSKLRSSHSPRHRTRRALAAASAATRRDEIVLAATTRAGVPPRL